MENNFTKNLVAQKAEDMVPLLLVEILKQLGDVGLVQIDKKHTKSVVVTDFHELPQILQKLFVDLKKSVVLIESHCRDESWVGDFGGSL